MCTLLLYRIHIFFYHYISSWNTDFITVKGIFLFITIAFSLDQELNKDANTRPTNSLFKFFYAEHLLKAFLENYFCPQLLKICIQTLFLSFFPQSVRVICAYVFDSWCTPTLQHSYMKTQFILQVTVGVGLQ